VLFGWLVESCVIVLASQQFLACLWTDIKRTDVAMHVEFLAFLSIPTKNLVWQLHNSLMIFLSSFWYQHYHMQTQLNIIALTLYFSNIQERSVYPRI